MTLWGKFCADRKRGHTEVVGAVERAFLSILAERKPHSSAATTHLFFRARISLSLSICISFSFPTSDRT